MMMTDCQFSRICLALLTRILLISANCDQEVNKEAVFCSDGDSVAVSLICSTGDVVVIRKTGLYQGDGDCHVDEDDEYLPGSACFVNDFKLVAKRCHYKNKCSLTVDVASYSNVSCTTEGDKFIYVQYQCDPEFYKNDRAKSSIIASATEGSANLLYIYSHLSVAKVPKGCIIRILAGTRTVVEATLFRTTEQDCTEKVTALLVDEKYDICDKNDRFQFECSPYHDIGIFISYEGEKEDDRPEFVIKVSTPPMTEGIKYQCGVNKSTYLQEYSTTEKYPATKEHATTTSSATDGVKIVPRTSNYDLLIGAVVSAGILLVLIVTATLVVGCKRETDKLEGLQDELDSRFTTIRRNIYVGGQSSSRLVLTKSELT